MNKEPLRAAWAIGQLLEQELFETTFNTLEKLADDFSYTARLFRSYVFSSLGEHLDTIPENYYLRLRLLCEKVKDGALAALISQASINQEKITDKNIRFIGSLFRIAIKQTRCSPELA